MSTEIKVVAVKKAVVSVSGNMNKIKIDGKVLSREQIKKLSPEAGIVYLGRNSNPEKCISCSPKSADVHWMHISFQDSNEISQDLWICESCARSYPSGKGKKNYPLFLNLKK